MRLSFPEFVYVAGSLWSTAGMVLWGKGWQPAGKSLPAPVFARNLARTGPDRHGTQASAVEGRWLTSCAMVRPLLQSLRYEILLKTVVPTEDICYRCHVCVTQQLPVIRDEHFVREGGLNSAFRSLKGEVRRLMWNWLSVLCPCITAPYTVPVANWTFRQLLPNLKTIRCWYKHTVAYIYIFYWRYNPLCVCILQPSSGL